jgi:acyl-CoA ligase (AMP-forming) (exosortase A-associated)
LKETHGLLAFTFNDLLELNLQQRGDHPLVVEGERSATYAEVARAAAAVAAALADAGVQRGDRVVVHLHKSLAEVVAMFAVARLGAIFVNISHQWTVEQLEYVLGDSGACVLFTDSRMARALAARALPPSLRRVIVNGAAPDDQRMVSWSALPTSATGPAPRGIDTDLAAILYTSGSTGAPKGVMLTHANLLHGARSVARYLENAPHDRLLSLLPFSFDYGLSQLTTMCLVGGTVVLQPVMMAAEIVKTLAEQQATGFAAVPPAWIQVVRYLVERPTGLPALRYVTNSGGKIPDGILRQMPRVFPGAKIFLMYGLTEAFRSTYLPPELFDAKMGSMGRAIPNVEVYVINPEIGVCGPGQQGELVHRGSLVSRGYWGKPEDTAAKIRPCPELRHLIGDEPVVYSGDIVRLDDDGYLWFVGRNDSMIKVSGFRISPTEVEDVVFRSGLVAEVVAFGVAHELDGQAVEIAVTAKGGAELDGGELLAYCRRHMPTYMVPRRVHTWSGEFPRSGSGKIDRPQVTRRYGGA